MMIILSSTVVSYRVGRRGWPTDIKVKVEKVAWNCLVKVPEPIFTVEQRFVGKRWLSASICDVCSWQALSGHPARSDPRPLLTTDIGPDAREVRFWTRSGHPILGPGPKKCVRSG
jgi:hypothetical protein